MKITFHFAKGKFLNLDSHKITKQWDKNIPIPRVGELVWSEVGEDYYQGVIQQIQWNIENLSEVHIIVK
jgi:hypothetical protein